jgi:hypothetical protein
VSTLGFHAHAPGGGEGRVLELGRPAADGTVAVREWTEGAYLGPAAECVLPAAEVAERVRRWARDGWTLTQPPALILHWLGAD